MGFYSNVILPRFYDRLIDEPGWVKYRQQLLATACGNVLEIGAGTGLNLPHYPAQVSRITTVDPNPGMNKLLRLRSAETAIEVDQHVTSGEELPFDDATFDCVVTTMTLCSIPKVDLAMRELFRVLRPGGRYLFLEHGICPDPKVRKWQHRLNWLQRIVGAGCRLDLDVRATVAAEPFASVETDNFFRERVPRTHGYMYRGVAVK